MAQLLLSVTPYKVSIAVPYDGWSFFDLSNEAVFDRCMTEALKPYRNWLAENGYHFVHVRTPSRIGFTAALIARLTPHATFFFEDASAAVHFKLRFG